MLDSEGILLLTVDALLLDFAEQDLKAWRLKFKHSAVMMVLVMVVITITAMMERSTLVAEQGKQILTQEVREREN